MTIWISHRGYCRDASENTAEAFEAALALGFRHLETDLRCTADGHLVLSHDADLARVSGRSVRVEDATRSQLEKIHLKFGERLVFFEQFLQDFSGYRWILDIKPESAVSTIHHLLKWWRNPAYTDFFEQRVRFLFWRAKHERLLRVEKPNAICMAKLNECRRACLACALGAPAIAGIAPGVTYALPPRFKTFDLMRRVILERYWQQGARVLAYLPECDADVQRALSLGADEILTNVAPLNEKL